MHGQNPERLWLWQRTGPWPGSKPWRIEETITARYSSVGSIALFNRRLGNSPMNLLSLLDGLWSYVITFPDVYSRFCFAWASHSYGSEPAREVYRVPSEVFPCPLHYVFMDSVSELMKHFDEEPFIDPTDFNRPLIPWLLCFNAHCPHRSLNLNPPFQFLQQFAKCNMYWPETRASERLGHMLDKIVRPRAIRKWRSHCLLTSQLALPGIMMVGMVPYARRQKRTPIV